MCSFALSCHYLCCMCCYQILVSDWCVVLNFSQMRTCWQHLAYLTVTGALCYNSGLEALARQALSLHTHFTKAGYVLRSDGWAHCVEQGTLLLIFAYILGRASDRRSLRLWVILFVWGKPDALMSVGNLCWTNQNETFETSFVKCFLVNKQTNKQQDKNWFKKKFIPLEDSLKSTVKNTTTKT